ncbi:hypothetical protein GCM10028796_06930 [Ramlibacter monticola]|uniref:Uncharacterized protein n=1 Tax=Ramlibacter monticola TaxID=1926872 RepID=A0A937CRC1_9BURK|nr:hypothetical protein [Ramlibacter monticola]MBL0389554.1 hypothetical protein [Ramlibacter monticola]
MRWFHKDLKSTLSALLTVSTLAPPTAEDQAEKLDELRREMLALAVLTETNRSELLARRIRYAV